MAHVHGDAVVTKWIEDLIKPCKSQGMGDHRTCHCMLTRVEHTDVNQLYEYHASQYGVHDEIEEASSAQEQPLLSPSKKRRSRFCGCFPLHLLFSSAETKSIASAAQTSSDNGYGTLIPVSQAAEHTRAENGEGSRPPSRAGREQPLSSALKKSSSKDGGSSSALKRSKSKERVAFTPPAVSNLERVQSAKAHQASTSGSQAKLATSVPKPSYMSSGPSAKVDQNGSSSNHSRSLSKSETHPSNKKDNASKGPNGNQADKTEGVVLPKAAETSKPTTANHVTKASSSSTPSKSILQRDQSATASSSAARPVASLSEAASVPAPSPQVATPHKGKASAPSAPATAPTGTTTSKDAPRDDNAEKKAYLTALQSARSDPVAFLERHPMFHGRKAKHLSYDDVGSTHNKALVRVKIENQVISQGAAAGQDKTLAKARAAFKAIEALCVSIVAL